MSDLRPIYRGGRLIGFKDDATGQSYGPHVMATSPMVSMRDGAVHLAGGDPNTVHQLADAVSAKPNIPVAPVGKERTNGKGKRKQKPKQQAQGKQIQGHYGSHARDASQEDGQHGPQDDALGSENGEG